MKVLFVCSGNSKEKVFSIEKQKPFVGEQRDILINKGVKVDIFPIKGHGLIGYLKNLSQLKKKINENGYDLLHAHYGIAGMLSVMQGICPVIITFQGCDINRKDLRCISKLAMRYASHNIFVTQELADKARAKEKYSIIPYGIDYSGAFVPLEKQECRKELGLKMDEKIVLFSSSFDRFEKNYSLAKKAVELLNGVRLIELYKGYSRDEIVKLINACDLILMTSIREGSPQLIKEAMACNCPVVSTDVGDVKEILGDTGGCFLTSFEDEDVAEKVMMALNFGKKTDGRKRIKHLDINIITDEIIGVYKEVIGIN